MTETSWLVAAATVGGLHTLAGPDHYLPLIALWRERGWSPRRALGLTALCGVAHCLASVAIALLVIGALGTLAGVEVVQAWRGDLAAMLLIGLGVALLVRSRSSRVPAGLLLVFVLGPCEWLVPAMTGASAELGLAGACLVGVVFTLATVATMVALVAASAVVPRLSTGTQARALAGACFVACGALVLAGL